ncbi:MAG: DNA-binding NtrC family response regulator [Kiritimatiellia bacterium]|jgi:DNA-binding NtrC family response regulator
MSGRVLVVDDENVLRSNIIRFLTRAGHQAEGAATAEEALEKMVATNYAIVITDLNMPGMGGARLLSCISRDYPQTLVLVITAYATVDSALQALRLGAQDYLLKPLSLEEVARKVGHALRFLELEQRVQRLRLEVHRQFDTSTMVATSAVMRPVMKLVGKAASSRSTVLIEGQSGTGKELVARALHDLSPWKDKDFIAVNLAAQPRDLVDATLFGHDRGAFTGATRRREGVFRAVHGGTVFLDEVSELPADVQVKLLRVLESREVLPLGCDRPESVDFRLVVASNRSLLDLVEAGTFRQDLYFRLEVLRIELPPLRDRTQDIPLLVHRFVARHAETMGRPAPRLTHEAMAMLQNYAWPGNVRELSNVVERAVLLCEGAWIGPQDLSLTRTTRRSVDALDLKSAMAEFERAHIERVLKRCGGDKNEAAELLGVHLATLYRRMERLGLS